MPAPTTIDQLLNLVAKSGLVVEKRLDAYLLPRREAGTLPGTTKQLAADMVREGLLTNFQAGQLLLGKWRGFTLNGKYKLLEHLGDGGMGSVYLCEHTSMRRRVAIKVLPVAKAKDTSYVERFYREARAVAALNHPNIVRAHDIDHDGQLHFLVMEYVDGASLQDIVRKQGPLEVRRAAHYISQAAEGLQHAHEAGLVHRDIKPANLLVDRSGAVKILDLGLARFFHDDDNLSKKYDEAVLGTSDYLAPEQALDSDVDIRADIYSLGATFYFLLTGQTLFGEGTASQKLIWHQTRQAKSISSLRAEVPSALAGLIEHRMVAKRAEERFQNPIDICEALAPWTAETIPPPAEEEMPRLCKAARGENYGEAATGASSSALTTRSRIRAASSLRQGSSSASRIGATRPELGITTAPADDSKTTPPIRAGGADTDADVPTIAAPIRTRPWYRRPAVWAPFAAVLFLLLAGVGGVWWWIRNQGPSTKSITQASSSTIPPKFGQAALPPATIPATGVAMQVENGGMFRVKTEQYEAVVRRDGCLTNLRIGGIDFLQPDKAESRGVTVVHNGKHLDMPKIEKPAPNVIQASCDLAVIRYEYGAETVVITLANRSNQQMSLAIIFSPTVCAVRDGDAEWSKVPIDKQWDPRDPGEERWQTTNWFDAQRHRLTISGGTKAYREPFTNQNLQMWEAVLQPGETRSAKLTAGKATPVEANDVKKTIQVQE